MDGHFKNGMLVAHGGNIVGEMKFRDKVFEDKEMTYLPGSMADFVFEKQKTTAADKENREP